MTETLVFDFVHHRVVLLGASGEERPAPDDLNLVSTGAAKPNDDE